MQPIITQILKMSQEITNWVEKKDGNDKNIINVKHDLQCIRIHKQTIDE